MLSNNEPTEIIFFDGSEYFQAVLNDISKAKTSIDLETYIFDSDKLGNKIADTLIKAAKNNVHIRVLVDGAGAPGWGGRLTKKMENAGIETRVFHPFPWRLWHWSRSAIRLPLLRKFIHFIFNTNARNHRKVFIIDKEIVYVGSTNISQCHLSAEEGGDGWRDTGVKLIKPSVKDVQNAFDAAWEHVAIQDRIHGLFKPVNINPIFRINNTRHRRRVLYKNLLRRIAKCKRRVWITNAYFVPDNRLLKKLKDLAEKGVDVRILLPHKSDVVIMPWASSTFYQNLLRSGVRIFEYIPSILHAKTLILDDWFIVGSSNLNHRSLLHDLEIDVHITSPTAKQMLEQKFLEDIQNSREVRLVKFRNRRWWQKFFGRLILYIKYWI